MPCSGNEQNSTTNSREDAFAKDIVSSYYEGFSTWGKLIHLTVEHNSLSVWNCPEGNTWQSVDPPVSRQSGLRGSACWTPGSCGGGKIQMTKGLQCPDYSCLSQMFSLVLRCLPRRTHPTPGVLFLLIKAKLLLLSLPKITNANNPSYVSSYVSMHASFCLCVRRWWGGRSRMNNCVLCRLHPLLKLNGGFPVGENMSNSAL